MKLVKFIIAEELLHKVLKLPSGCSIIYMSTEMGMEPVNRFSVTVLIEDGNPYIIPNNNPIDVTPIITQEHTEYKWDWNIPEENK